MGNHEVIIEPKTEKAMRMLVLQCRRVVHPVGKTIPEVQKAYLAGFIDGDGAIMALLERHPTKRFGFRVRVWVKATQLRQQDVAWLSEALGVGQVRLARFGRVANAGNGWSKTSQTHDGFCNRFNHLLASKRSR